MKKPTRKYNNLSRKVKTVVPGKTITPRKGEWETSKIEDRRGQEKGQARNGLSRDALVEMAKDKASGKTDKQLSTKYCVTKSYVADALQDLFINDKQGRAILKGVLRQNAIASAMHGATKIHELNGMQSAVATKIYGDALINQEKHESSMPKEVDIEQLGEVERLLKELDSDFIETEGRVLDEEV